MLPKKFQAAALFALAALSAPARAADYTTPFPPFHIAGNIYYVGA